MPDLATRLADKANDFRAWEARMGFSRVADVAAQLGVSRQTASDLRNGHSGLSPPIRRLMFVLEWCRSQQLSVPTEQGQ